MIIYFSKCNVLNSCNSRWRSFLVSANHGPELLLPWAESGPRARCLKGVCHLNLTHFNHRCDHKQLINVEFDFQLWCGWFSCWSVYLQHAGRTLTCFLLPQRENNLFLCDHFYNIALIWGELNIQALKIHLKYFYHICIWLTCVCVHECVCESTHTCGVPLTL